MIQPTENLPGVILLGGLANTLALCRSLGRAGIEVTVCARSKCPAHFSRFCSRRLQPAVDETDEAFWRRVLIDDIAPENKGNVIFACNDEAIDFVARQAEALSNHFIIEKNPSAIRLSLLDKKQSIQIANRAGLNVPKIEKVSTPEDVRKAIDHFKLPVLVRPLISHKFTAVFGNKLILCHSEAEVHEVCNQAFENAVEITLCEYVPGDDSCLCSYYTYMDDAGNPLFAFTKRVLRKHPYNFGEASYHETAWLPDVAEAGQRFFDEAGLRGLGNIEFKRDPRDGQLKFIECNARFTAAHEIFIKCNFDIGLFIYGQLTGNEFNLPATFKEGVNMSISFRDLRAIRFLAKKGQASVWSWFGETLRAEAKPYFQLTDPIPYVVRMLRNFL